VHASSSISGNVDRQARDQNSNFDFEAAAFGSGGAPIDKARPGGDSGLGAALVLPVPTANGHWQKHIGSSVGPVSSSANEGLSAEDAQSAASLARGLGLRFPEQAHSHRRPDVKRDATKRLSEDLVEGRQKLEQSLADKRRLQRQQEKARQKVEAIQSDRQAVVAELTTRQCDVQHAFAQLDFARQQIEVVEREISYMHAVRQASSQDDVRRMERTRSRFEGERASLGEDRHNTKASVEMSQDMLKQDRKHCAELSEKVKRSERRKMELQSRQNILLEEQRQAEQDRTAMLYALELERVKLHTMRSERLDLGSSSRQILEEARKLSRDKGIEPAVFADLFLPHSKEESSKVPIDPLVENRTSHSSWGPAVDHARAFKDTSAWKTAVYRSGGGGGVPASDALRSGVSGGNMELTASPPRWTQFPKDGVAPAGYDRGFNHARMNQGLRGVPAGGQDSFPPDR